MMANTFDLIQTIMFQYNVQHDCWQAKCVASGKQAVIQEHVQSEVSESSCFIKHKPLDRFLINTHAFTKHTWFVLLSLEIWPFLLSIQKTMLHIMCLLLPSYGRFNVGSDRMPLRRKRPLQISGKLQRLKAMRLGWLEGRGDKEMPLQKRTLAVSL
jgi:hypothetical protein